VYSKEKQHYRK